MKKSILLILAGLVGGLAGAASATEPLGPRVDRNLLPVPPAATAEPGLKFSHQLHVEDMGTECAMCHESVAEAGTLSAVEVPGHDVCANCHDLEDESSCATCHVNPEDPSGAGLVVSEAIRFNHQKHLAGGAECATCHGGIEKSQKVGEAPAIGHDTCNDCHKAEFNRLACSSCHTSMDKLARSPEQVAVHGSGFFAVHDSWAVGNSAACAQCHEQQFCSDCHTRTMPERPSVVFPEKVDSEFIHRGDFIGRHALEASARPGSCQTCHGQSFCSSCHEAQLARSDRTGFAASPHPQGYLTRGGEGFHGSDARLNPQQCATCHDQGAASNCVTCHRVGGVGGNPHPPGFDGDDRSRNGPACTPCHGG